MCRYSPWLVLKIPVEWLKSEVGRPQIQEQNTEQKLSGIKVNLLLLRQISLPFESWEGGTNTAIFRELSE